MREEKRGSTVRKRKQEHLGEESGIEQALITRAALNLTETSKFKACFSFKVVAHVVKYKYLYKTRTNEC